MLSGKGPLNMNKAITDGLTLTPPPFLDGLAVWSSEDGTPGSVTYDAIGTAATVPGDVDFGGCDSDCFRFGDGIKSVRFVSNGCGFGDGVDLWAGGGVDV